jgi:hypothetical protein
VGAGDFHQLMRNREPSNRHNMSDELDELQDTLNLDEETIQETELESTGSEEVDIEALKAQAAKADEYKSYADRVVKENKELKKKSEPLTTKQSSSDSDERFERLELKTEGYKSEEVDFLMQNGGRKALENPIVMAGIEAARKKQKSLDATPSGTGKSPVYQKFTEQDLKKMPLEDLEKIVPQ